MEDGKKHLTLPSNYVTLAQLRERWLNEQQRKQREKEEEERKQREKEQEEKRKQRDQENQRRNQNGQKSRTNSVSVSRHRPLPRNHRNQSEKNRRTVEVSEPKSDESGIEAINCQVQNGGESKKKKNNNKKRWKMRKSRAQEDLTYGTSQLPPENEAEEKVPVVVTEINSEKVKTGSEFRPNGEKSPVYDGMVLANEPEEEIPVVMTERNDEKEGVRSNFRPKRKSLPVYGKVWEQKGLLDGSAEIRPNFKNLSLNGGKESSQRLTAEMNGGHRKYNTRKPMDANLVWVRKREISDAEAEAEAASTQSSGSLVKGGKGKNPER